MDIVVTIPKTRLKLVEEEEARVAEGMKKGEDWMYFWSIPTEPRNAGHGDRMYFVWEGAVRAYHVILGFDENRRCDHSRVLFPGLVAVLKPEIHEIKPVPMKGFRGYRYIDRRKLCSS